jgi:hypothetical protein
MQYTKQSQATNLGDTHAHRLLVLLLLMGCPCNHPLDHNELLLLLLLL